MDARKLALIEALRVERKRFEQTDPTEHDVTIKYLESGEITANPEKYALLDAAINDYETLCSDYGV